ncbi:MAG: hypothetical protein QOF91_73 [Alphaproteobacteria bacterium]|jgi:hypothetical protein|nr:hypothetical protein [Alphaproteobacteria bacterium]MEA3024788.1 hypothetical protein [Alphaproteobacteria bacterium]
MQPIKLKLSTDNTHATLSAATTDLSAHDIDRLIRDLAAVRAKMTPVHPAEPPQDPGKLHQSDNLLWSVKAAPEKSAIRFATQHPGLGWMAMWLSRAQVEDLQTSFEFELVKIPEGR